ncbi:MAG: response regulator [Desulfarculales bacterium]|nr:response regulator [Desulfarculales bacterium]
MKHTFSLQYKIILALVLFMNVPFVVTAYLAKNLAETMIIQEKESKLLSLTRILDTFIIPGGYEEILRQHGAEQASREDQIKILNNSLRDATNMVGRSSPGLGVGYYSRALDAIITYGPEPEMEAMVGISIAQDHPGRLAMRDNQEMVRMGTMVRGDIMNAMHPIERGGKVIGYIWANELRTYVDAQLSNMNRKIIFVSLVCFILTILLLILLARRTMRNVDNIITGLRKMRQNIHQRIPEAKGDLGEVVNTINAMAGDIATATDESQRLIAVLQNLMSNIDSTIYVCDPQNKILVYVNDHLCRLLNQDNLQGKSCHEILHGRPYPCPDCPIGQLFDPKGVPLSTPLHREKHYNLLNRDFLVTSRMVTWQDGRLLYMEIGTDITERNALAMAEAANQAQREFLARMSHEIRTPMHGVLGMTQLAIQDNPSPTQMEYLRKIQSSASILLGIINDILDFSKIEAGKLSIESRSFSLHELTENIRELILPRIQEKNLQFNLEIANNVPQYAMGDELRLSQVMLNLLSNAAKFTSQGSVTMTMYGEKQPTGKIRLYCAIKDSGIGMSQEEQTALFKPFSQADASTSRKFGGTGLGLSISKALVELMGGSIAVESTPGQGSVFSFFVDVTPLDKPQKNSDKTNIQMENQRYDSYYFLLVEDNKINQEIALAILRKLGATVEVANNGKEGLEAFLHKDYDLVLMDIRMPIMDGFEATKLIRSSGKYNAITIPIVAMTANAMQEDREASKAAGMNAHIAKPIDLHELKSVLYNCLIK